MKSCDTCAKRGSCTRVIGIMFGVCNVDYEPAAEILIEIIETN